MALILLNLRPEAEAAQRDTVENELLGGSLLEVILEVLVELSNPFEWL